MNYQKIYDALCARGNARLLAGGKKPAGYEDHHIVPRSMGGGNEKPNIARLTIREHVLAHRLLVKTNPSTGNYSALNRMISGTQGVLYNAPLHVILAARKGQAESARATFARFKNDPARKTKALASLKQKFETDSAFRLQRSEAGRMSMQANWSNPSFRKKVSVAVSAAAKKLNAMSDYAAAKSVRSRIVIQKLNADPGFQAKAKAGKLPGTAKAAAIVAVGKSVMCVEEDIIFSALSEAAAWLKSKGKDKAVGNKIGMCCAGKIKSAYGYTWKYIQKGA